MNKERTAKPTGERDAILETALEVGALLYGKFTLASGMESSFYFDGRLLTLSPKGGDQVGRALLPMVRASGADAIGGPTSGADPMVAAVSLLSYQDGGKLIPGFFVRPKIKDHGTGKLIEGLLPENGKVAIVDDTCSTAGSLFQAIEAVESAGCQVVVVITILDRNQGGSEKLRKSGYMFRTLLESDQDGRITVRKPDA